MALATLSIDLVAKLANLQTGMERANRLVEQSAGRMEAAFSAVRTAAASIGAGLAGFAIAGNLRSTVDALNEVFNASQLAGTGVEEFQRLAVAAETVGISQGKLADQLKDFREKVGEFLQTGGGGMKDFFEVIAPRIGITAEAFRNLSGPQALQLYFDALQKAGLSQQEMSFFLESMASDTTALIPLLRDGGLRMQELGDRAQATGRIIGSDVVASARQLRSDLQELGMTTQSLAVQITGPGIQALAQLSRYLLEVARTEGIARAALITFGRVVAGATGTDEYGRLKDRAQAAQSDLTRLTDMAERYQTAISRGQDVERNTRSLERVRERIGQVSREALAAGQALKDFANASEASKPTLTDPGLLNAGGTGSGNKTGGKPTTPRLPPAAARQVTDYAAEINQALARMISDSDVVRARELNDQLERLNRLADVGLDPAIVSELRAKLTAKLPAPLEDPAEAFRRSELQQTEAVTTDATAAALARYNDQRDRLNALLSATPSAQLEQQRADMQLLADELERGTISQEQFIEAAQARLGTLNAELPKTQALAEQLGLSFSSAFEDAVAGAKSFRDVLDGLAQDLLRLATRQFITQPALNWLSGLSLFKFADGGVFDSPHLFRFANGGVPSLGMLGEAGPEAVMPLKRGPGGRLGVQVMGGSARPVQITQNITVGDGVSLSQVRAAMEVTKANTIAAIHDLRRRGAMA